jgi:hypothetical protein
MKSLITEETMGGDDRMMMAVQKWRLFFQLFTQN